MKNEQIVKYLVGGSGVAVFLGLTIWLVRSEGQRTRESVREAAKEAGAEVRKGIVEGAERAVEKAAELPGKVLHDIKKEVQDGVGEGGKLSGKAIGEVKDILMGKPDKPQTKEPAEGASAKEAPGPARPSPTASKPEKTAQTRQSPDTSKPDKDPAPPSPASVPPSAKPLPDPSNEKLPSAAAPSSGKTGAGTNSPKKPQKKADAIRELFDLGHRITKSVDEAGQEVLGLAPEEEKKVGKEVHELVCRDQKLLRSSLLVERLQRLAQPILELRTRKGIQYAFFVLASPKVNAFSHVGGYVYVNKGMLDFAKTDAELQFVLAHEIAHVDLKHVVKRITYSARAAEVAGEAGRALVQAAYLAIALGYSQDEEFEADAWAMRSMLQIGRTRSESLASLRHLLSYVQKKKIEPARPAPKTAGERTLRQIEDHFESHPPTAERLKRVEAIEG